jgi:hypothetical protein
VTAHRETFTCRIERSTDDRITSLAVDATDINGTTRTVHINGTTAIRIASSMHDVLRRGGIRPRLWGGTKPIPVEYVTGAHAELLLLAVRPLRRSDRAERIAGRIAQMSPEEASYWHAKSHQPGGLPALRVLLNGGAK